MESLIYSLVFGLAIAPVGILLIMFLTREPALDAMAAFDLTGRLLLYRRLLVELNGYRYGPANRFQGDEHDVVQLLSEQSMETDNSIHSMIEYGRITCGGSLCRQAFAVPALVQ